MHIVSANVFQVCKFLEPPLLWSHVFEQVRLFQQHSTEISNENIAGFFTICKTTLQYVTNVQLKTIDIRNFAQKPMHFVLWKKTSAQCALGLHDYIEDNDAYTPFTRGSKFASCLLYLVNGVLIVGYGCDADNHNGATHPVAYMNITPDITEEGFVQIYVVTANVSVVHITVMLNLFAT